MAPAAEMLANWQEQLEEVTALQAICGEDFVVLAEGFGGVGANGDAAEAKCRDVAAQLPVEPLECQAAIHVELPSDGLTLAMSEREAVGVSLADADSKAGSRAAAGMRIRHLPPLCLRLRFTRVYPSAAAPDFSLSALWLSAAGIQELAAQLMRLWDEQGAGQPICYMWIDWLQANALAVAGADRVLRLDLIASAAAAPAPAANECTQPSPSQPEAVPATASLPKQGLNPHAASWSPNQRDSPAAGSAAAIAPGGVAVESAARPAASQQAEGAAGPPAAALPRLADELLMQLMLYDAARSYSLFRQGTWQCPVCFDEKPGTACCRLDCQHIFCEECVRTHASMHVQEGSLDLLHCLDPSCHVRLDRQLLEKLLSVEQLQRMENISLQRALDRMTDLLYCPKCASAALEDEDHCTQCPKCLFVFCSLCNESWHPGTRCMSPETQLELLRQRMRGNKSAVEEFRRKEQECLSLATIKDTSKQCPVCGMATQKTEGCNKMVCGSCSAYWCFKCLKAIKGYDHYKDGSCVLFDDAEIARWNLQWDAAVVRQEAHLAQQQFWPADEAQTGMRPAGRHHCPTCGAMNIKVANNNHISCWACTTPFCAVCRKTLRQEGGRHFLGKSGCKQHTRD